MQLSDEDRLRLGALLAARAAAKAHDAREAEARRRHPGLIDQLKEDSEWSRGIAVKLLGDDYVEPSVPVSES